MPLLDAALDFCAFNGLLPGVFLFTQNVRKPLAAQDEFDALSLALATRRPESIVLVDLVTDEDAGRWRSNYFDVANNLDVDVHEATRASARPDRRTLSR